MSGRYLLGASIVGGTALALLAIHANSADRQTATGVADQRLQVAREAMRVMDELRKTGEGPVTGEQFYRWSRRLMEAEQGNSANNAARIAAIQAHLNRLKAREETIQQAYRAAEVSQMDLLEVQWHRLEAEFWLSQAKAG